MSSRKIDVNFVVQSSKVSSVECQLRDFGDFLESYDTKLSELMFKSDGVTQNFGFILQNCGRAVGVNYSTDQEMLALGQIFQNVSIQKEQIPNKMIMTLAFLCNESVRLAENIKDLQLQFLYLDEKCGNISDAWSNKVKYKKSGRDLGVTFHLLKMSNSIEFLCKMKSIIQTCLVVSYHLVHQCGLLFLTDGSIFKFSDVIDYLAEIILRIKISDDILSQSNFCQLWLGYKKALSTVIQNAKIESSTSEINALQNWIGDLDVLFSGTLFQDFLKSMITFKDNIGAKTLETLSRKFNEYIKYQLDHLERFISPNLNDSAEAFLLVRINVFFVFCHDLCGLVEGRLVKRLLLLNAKHPVISLTGNIIWKTETFLQRHGKDFLKQFQKLIENDNRQKPNLNVQMEVLRNDCRVYWVQISKWLLLANKYVRVTSLDMKVEQFNRLATILNQGLQYTVHVGFLVNEIVNSHISLRVAISKTTLASIYKLIEMIKSIQLILQQNYDTISRMVQCILQHLQHEVFLIITSCKRKVMGKSSTMNDCCTNALVGLKTAEKCLTGPATRTRILILKLAMNLFKNFLDDNQDDRLVAILKNIKIFYNFQDHLKNSYDSSFVHWHRSMLSSYLKQFFGRDDDFNYINIMTQGLDNCNKEIKHAKITASDIIGAYQQLDFASTRKDIVGSLCAHIEIYLRVEVHFNLNLGCTGTDQTDRIVNDYKSLIEMSPLEVNGNFVLLKYHIENYLSSMFYNLTAINLHDWKTYENMRQVAKARLNLVLFKSYLPNYTLEQGVDILEIMHNIEDFVSKNVYNMHTQVFVEYQSGGKHLRVFGIRHMTNSLCTHGLGIINTSINFIYQVLRHKFYTFSQFLYDEQIKARLMKELRLVTEHKRNGQNPLFPYERAEAFNKDIRSLGISSDGYTFMDLFRKLITHIGNAMGYVRLMRSSSIHVNYLASLYLAKFEGEINFLHKSMKDNLQDISINSAKNLEINISNLNKFFDGTDYFKILMNAFHPFFTNPNNTHLNLFYLILPALTLNYVEYVLNAREKIKTERNEPLFFDDGFSIGLAYILLLLNQIGEFNSLQWFVVVRNHLEAGCQKIKARGEDVITSYRKIGIGSTNIRKVEHKKLQQTLALTERRIRAYQDCFHLLYSNLCSAKVLFQ